MKRITYILLLIVGAIIGQGCSSQDIPDTPMQSEDVCELVFTLNTGSSLSDAPSSRADDLSWSDNPNPETGSNIENILDHVSLYLATDAANVPLTLVGHDISDGKYEYRVKVALGVVNATPVGTGLYRINGRLVAVVNHPAKIDFSDPFNPDPMDIDDIISQEAIPMWGVKTLSDVTIASNSTVHIGEVKLLRAIPKISISLDDQLKSIYKITSIKEDRPIYRRFALCTPTGALTAASTEELLIEGAFNPSTSLDTGELRFQGLGTDRTWSYLPETPLSLTGGIPESLTVTLERKDGTGAPFTGKIYLCDYVDGLPNFDSAFKGLVRNHHYQYRISLRELQFVVQVSKWIYGGKLHLELE